METEISQSNTIVQKVPISHGQTITVIKTRLITPNFIGACLIACITAFLAFPVIFNIGVKPETIAQEEEYKAEEYTLKQYILLLNQNRITEAEFKRKVSVLDRQLVQDYSRTDERLRKLFPVN